MPQLYGAVVEYLKETLSSFHGSRQQVVKRADLVSVGGFGLETPHMHTPA